MEKRLNYLQAATGGCRSVPGQLSVAGGAAGEGGEGLRAGEAWGYLWWGGGGDGATEGKESGKAKMAWLGEAWACGVVCGGRQGDGGRKQGEQDCGMSRGQLLRGRGIWGRRSGVVHG